MDPRRSRRVKNRVEIREPERTVNIRLSRECRVELNDILVDMTAYRNRLIDSTDNSMPSTIEVEQSERGASATNDLVVSLVDSEDDDTSVIFVEEQEATPKTKKIAEQNDEISRLNVRVRSLQIHVGALEAELRNKQESSDDTEMRNVSATDLGITFDENWAANQIEEWRANGELDVVCSEFQNFVDNAQID
ncbi:uncharacterized protein LOC129571159 [Sitodiplosis mosellana]|uniref:uncharacterized protein LOC129571159 n=1 Tax=Sitodiplosis mosellana TaxID=263140 RepID=UPI0024453842|nr:uncharacterized protein LOC129571159 [Sitodiplosis mosellana]